MIPVQTKKKGVRTALRMFDAERVRHEQIEHGRDQEAKDAAPVKTKTDSQFKPRPEHWLLSAAGVLDKTVTMTPELDAESIEFLRAAAERCRAIAKLLKEAQQLAFLMS